MPTNPETQPTDNNEPARPRDAQDREIANGISTAKNVITVLEDDTEVSGPMSERGYDEDEVSAGSALQIAAQGTYNKRQKAMGDLEDAADTLKKTIAKARKGYADFRRVARAKFKKQADRTTLALTGVVPKDVDNFITVATTSYTEAGGETYQAAFAKKGYNAAALVNLLNGLKAIDTATKDFKAKSASAQKATKMRDTAYGDLKNWVVELRETAKVVFGDAPEQARKLDF